MSIKGFLSYRWLAVALLNATTLLGTIAFAGCERKEKVVDIEAPGVDVEVERNVDTGAVDVETTEN